MYLQCVSDDTIGYILFFFPTEKCQGDDGRQWDKSSCGSFNISSPSHFQGCGAATGNLTHVVYDGKSFAALE